jgi:hypothetical protein
MSVKSWHSNPQAVEIDRGLARAGAAKRLDPLVTHPHMANRTSTSLGAPPTGAPPDASAPLPTDVEKQHGSKTLPIPKCNPGTPSRPDRGYGSIFDPDNANKVVGEAILSGSTRLPDSTSENT